MRARSGEQVRLVDHKVAYNGAEGLPIREEIIERHGDSVITRNSYGALCLNTPDVLFADVDVKWRSHSMLGWIIFFAILAIGLWQKRELDAWWPLIVAAVIGIIVAEPISTRVSKWIAGRTDNPFDAALAQFEKFASSNPAWVLRIYRTPKGFRILAMHQTFNPSDDAAFNFMSAVGSDKLYMQMCRNQNCFRARVSPKPWRIGVGHIKPQPGVWPIRKERLPDRQRWVENYTRKSAGFAACRFVKTLGNGGTDRKCEQVRKVHDRLCKVDSTMPIA